MKVINVFMFIHNKTVYRKAIHKSECISTCTCLCSWKKVAIKILCFHKKS